MSRSAGGPRLQLRPAGSQDAAALRDWRNDPDTRTASRTTEAVTREQHERWLAGVLVASDRHLLVGELDGVPVGQVRLDARDGGRYEISVSLAPEHRGRGFGTALIAAGTRWAWVHTDAARVEAEVGAENERSLRAFVAAGYTLTGRSGDWHLLVVERAARGAS